MIYSDFKDIKLSKLGFGAMRLPLIPGTQDIDEEQVFAMVKRAAEGGINYFDTAYPYHDGKSEIVLGKALKQLPRDSYYLATKFPGHQPMPSYDVEAIFEEQLRKCGVDYFDFYLLHNVYENSLPVYTDERWGIIDYLVKQREAGRIKYLGFSSHGTHECLKTFIEKYYDVMDFAQIQLNYLDWDLQGAMTKVQMLMKANLPVFAMEPVRGGMLANLSPENEAKFKALHPDWSIASWAFRYMQFLPMVTMTLSGMSSMEQLEDNLHTYEQDNRLGPKEFMAVREVAHTMYDLIPCTGCRYCMRHCPMGLDIPMLLPLLNEVRVKPTLGVGMILDALPDEKKPSACIGCGACAEVCPQKLEIPDLLAELDESMAGVPHWSDICDARFKAAEKLRNGEE